jgi:hypothetical protein
MAQTINNRRLHMALARSIVFSLLASVLATVAARGLLSVSQPLEDEGRQRRRAQTLVIVVPILVGNSNNRIGWVKEVHHHRHALFGRGGS